MMVSPAMKSSTIGMQYIGGTGIRHKQRKAEAVSIAIKNSIKSFRVHEWEDTNENVWVCMITNEQKRIYFNLNYIPPTSVYQVYEQIFANIADRINNDRMNSSYLIIGDFNLPTIQWISNEEGHCLPDTYEGRSANELIFMMASTELKQINNVSNMRNRILDLCLCNDNRIVLHRTNEPLVDESRHHPAFEIEWNCGITHTLNDKQPPRRNFFRANYELINKAITDINWT